MVTKTGWDRSLGTSKREQGIVTPKRTRNKVNPCGLTRWGVFRKKFGLKAFRRLYKKMTSGKMGIGR